jgi:flagellar biosynthetic protein FlhB
VRGFKNLFSLSAMMRLVMAAIKITTIGLIAFTLLRSKVVLLFALPGKSAWGALHVAGGLCMSLVGRIAAAMVAVAVLDYGYQRWQNEKQLMMTKSELKEEHKRDEGDPEIRGRQAQMRRSVVRARMIQAVPEADVLVTNPDHVAVALRWDEKTMSAPRVVAKGADHLARRMKQVARKHGVPIVERRPLARALYQAVEVGMEIPPKLYYAVAEVLAFVMKRRRPA